MIKRIYNCNNWLIPYNPWATRLKWLKKTQCWMTAADGGPTFKQHWFSVSCWLWIYGITESWQTPHNVLTNQIGHILSRDEASGWGFISALTLLYSAEIFSNKPSRPNVFFFQFEIIMNALVSSFCIIWISMWWVYSHYNLFNSFSARTVFRRPNQILWVYGHHNFFNSFSVRTVFRLKNLKSTDIRFWRLKTVLGL